jgi:hypothetical protein
VAEIWKAVVGWEGLYEVSDLGRVRSPRGVRKLVPIGDDKAKYLSVTLSRPGAKLACARVHRLVLTAFDRPALAGEEGRHKDGDSSNNALSNLEWGTPVQNGQDRVAHGTQHRGESTPSAKLTEEDVLRIREAVLFGAKQRVLGCLYGVNQQQVSKIVSRQRWAHVA